MSGSKWRVQKNLKGEAKYCEQIVHPLGQKRMLPLNETHARYKTKYAISLPLKDSFFRLPTLAWKKFSMKVERIFLRNPQAKFKLNPWWNRLSILKMWALTLLLQKSYFKPGSQMPLAAWVLMQVVLSHQILTACRAEGSHRDFI